MMKTEGDSSREEIEKEDEDGLTMAAATRIVKVVTVEQAVMEMVSEG